MDRLHRIKLLLGDEKVKKLQNATVMVVGCGAVGSFAIEALARSGIGHLILVDFDNVEETNTNRQLFAFDSTVGKSKVYVAQSRISDINKDIKTTAINTFWDENTDIEIKPDFVIDAIDTIKSKIAIYKWCNKNNIPFISSMGAGRKTDLTKIQITNISKTSVCPLASKIRHEIKNLNIPDFPVVFSTQVAQSDNVFGKTFGSIITVTGCFGLYMADYVVKQLCK
ncbi:MAG: tRNA threonylcarbamoyladenosine dehydratase [Alphaproteobacteria bacterium]|nr:tRNA threonylcarbamoyladenosine dehydratase [Alphaproteobacteria bacterium]